MMEDQKIVELYWSRDEQAITETKKKYDNYCFQFPGLFYTTSRTAKKP